MNDIILAMRDRRSIRKYKTEIPSQELLDQVVDAGLWAANGKNLQNTKFLVVKNRALRDKLSRLNCQIGGWDSHYDPFYGAPVVIVVLDKKGTTHMQKDGCAAMSNMMLAAYSLGLGTCWINRAQEMFELDAGKAILKEYGYEPNEWEGVANLVMGYVDGDYPQSLPRKEGRIIIAE